MGIPVTHVTSRKITSGMSKRLRDAVKCLHGLSLFGAQATELVAALLDYDSANHMAVSLKALEAAAPAGAADLHSSEPAAPSPVSLQDLLSGLRELTVNLSNVSVQAVHSGPAQLRRAIGIGSELLVRLETGSLQQASDWICVLADLLEMDDILDPLVARRDGQSEEILDEMLLVLSTLIRQAEAAAGPASFRTGPVHGADPDMHLFDMLGDYGSDSNEWGAHVPARDEDEAITIARTVMTENSGLDPETDGVEEFDIINSFQVDPRKVAASDLAENPEFNTWSPAVRAARVELRARDYLRGAGM